MSFSEVVENPFSRVVIPEDTQLLELEVINFNK
jgi:hypothetical protein